ncbi:hypothetical protein [Noviherbaspirillum pedocola]|uniref:Stability/partitioning determinant n=1 Tax=Noviherbaspirillum pedocola TaxID=2801341 RepID=A0A934T0J5_9BURK|nr:hypothetical protein [Noviherbaspirillum pedocola]MBK4739222.1 hypothetical protein [Noviherbaspirillum pedocola]
MNTPIRSNPVGILNTDDDDDLVPAPTPRPKLSKEQSEQIARQQGFSQGLPATAAPAPRKQRRHTTGRNQQVNVKATAETVERFNRIADELGVPLGEVLARALDALEKAAR